MSFHSFVLTGRPLMLQLHLGHPTAFLHSFGKLACDVKLCSGNSSTGSCTGFETCLQPLDRFLIYTLLLYLFSSYTLSTTSLAALSEPRMPVFFRLHGCWILVTSRFDVKLFQFGYIFALV